jgi:hypothetical protein
VEPVLHEIGDEHDLKELQNQRLAGNHLAKARCPVCPLHELQRRSQRHVRQCLNKQAADEEVEQVFPPVVAEDRLLVPAEQSLDRDEDCAEQDQIQQEKIQPEVHVSFAGHVTACP